MPHTNSNPNSGSHTPAKRSLPTWMSSKENSNKSQKKQNDACEILSKTDMEECTATSYDANQNNFEFSKLLEGVVFVLSGFVNPERSTLRAQAVEMGAEYQPDWTSGCTLLVCAFPNTPKFRQVETDNGTIVSKEWISECYNHKKLVDIERYLMHVGKPWRRCADQNQLNKGGSIVNQTVQIAVLEENELIAETGASRIVVGMVLKPVDESCGKERLVKFSSAVEVFSWNLGTEEGLLRLKKSAEEGCSCVGMDSRTAGCEWEQRLDGDGKRKRNELDGWFAEQNSKKRGVTAFGGRILQLAARRNYTRLQEIGKLQETECRTAVEPEGCGGAVFSGGETIS
ncbi:hypothetical protein IEQ34_022118 [Dendrobium chrysotoxum]|uniref:BRCT domain-containing protein n=1 Tax=Dendrobium chrysotoxum TaxID=161865 RepID=A0AAV7FXY1_DENCH|nr:hypothetical protein IEQ34_022118 [Dendrobium chrysotoxum]